MLGLRQMSAGRNVFFKLCWFYALLMSLCVAGLLGVIAVLINANPKPDIWIFLVFIFGFGTSFAAAYGFLSIAIGWSRWVLLGEVPDRYYVVRRDWPIRAYTIALVLVGTITILPPMVVEMALTIAFEGSKPVWLIVVSPLLIYSVSAWIFLRAGLILPAAAVGQYMSIRQSIRVTRPLSLRLFTIAVFAILPIAATGGISTLIAVQAGSEANPYNHILNGGAAIIGLAAIVFFLVILTQLFDRTRENQSI